MPESVFVTLVSVGLTLCGLVHLLWPVETERLMSVPANVRLAGLILLALVWPAIASRFYLLAILFAAFGLPRLLTPARSIRLQQRLYSRRVHGAILLLAASALWILANLVGR